MSTFPQIQNYSVDADLRRPAQLVVPFQQRESSEAIHCSDVSHALGRCVSVQRGEWQGQGLVDLGSLRLGSGKATELNKKIWVDFEEIQKNRRKRESQRLLRTKCNWLQRQSQKLLSEYGITAAITGCRKGARLRMLDGILSSRVDISVSVDAYGMAQARFSGLATCDSAWSCWICAPKKGAAMLAEASEVADQLLSKGYKFLMVTFTAHHDANMLLADFQKSFAESYRYMTSLTSFKKMMKQYGYIGSMFSSEVTADNPISYAYKTGWHYHRHYLYFYRGDWLSENNLKKLQSRISLFWYNSLQKYGLYCDQHGVEVSGKTRNYGNYKIAAQKGAKYLSKGAAFELVGSALRAKVTKKNRRLSPWELCILAIEGNKKAAAMYVEYYRAMKGKTFLRINKELRKLIDLADIEKKLAEFDDDPEIIASFCDPDDPACSDARIPCSADAWKLIAQQGRLGHMLTVTEEAFNDACQIGLTGEDRRDYVHKALLALIEKANNGIDVLTGLKLPSSGISADCWVDDDVVVTALT